MLSIFEKVFNHKAFTGRSGTFFGYEGLGSIYWHMVSKLYLAVYEVCKQAYDLGVDPAVQQQLATHFDEVGKGIGIHKSAELYGAFPTDAYSHTPAHKGAQQPGMTGQVKEDILARIGELGIELKGGVLQFDPFLLKESEFTDQKETFRFVRLNNESDAQEMEAKSIGFTLCQVPVIYTIGNDEGIKVAYSDGSGKDFAGNQIDADTTEAIQKRTGKVQKINVSLDSKKLR